MDIPRCKCDHDDIDMVNMYNERERRDSDTERQARFQSRLDIQNIIHNDHRSEGSSK